MNLKNFWLLSKQHQFFYFLGLGSGIIIPIYVSFLMLLHPLWYSFEANRPIYLESAKLSQSQKIDIAKQTILYLLSPTNNSTHLQAIYNSREWLHLQDVKRLMLGFHLLSTATLLIFVFGFFHGSDKRLHMYRGHIYGTRLLFILTTLMAVTVLTFWDQLFVSFHQVFFKPGTWQFEETDVLIQLFPPQFWFDTSLALITLILFFIAGINTVHYVSKKRKDKNNLQD